MKLKAVKFGAITFAILICGSFSVFSQNNCNLQFNVFVYDTASSSDTNINDVVIEIKSLQNKGKKPTTFDSTINGFRDLAEGEYEIKLSKAGYKKRKKKLNLECDFADNKKIVWENIYIWSDNSNPLIESKSQTGNKEIETDLKKSDTIQVENSADNSETEKSGITQKVVVRILIDEDGNVVSAQALEGKPEWADKAVKAARRAKFKPTVLANVPVKVTGNITYNIKL